MILRFVFRLVGSVVSWVFSFLGEFISLPAGFSASIVSFFETLVSGSAGFIFLVIRPSTFFAALDVLFFLYGFIPLVYFVRWLLRKLPILNIS